MVDDILHRYFAGKETSEIEMDTQLRKKGERFSKTAK
jgi:hypothetical protein